MNAGGICVCLRTEDLAAAGTAYSAVTLPDTYHLTSASIYADNVNCATGTPALTFDIKTGVAGSEASMLTAVTSGHVTNDNQELTPSIKKTTGANVDAATKRIRVETIGAGTTCVVKGVQFFLFFDRPLMP